MRQPEFFDRRVLDEQVKYMLSPKRYIHSRAVAELAEYWAILWREDKEKAYVAGLLHDVARELEDSELLGRARRYGLPLDEELQATPVILHAEVAAYMAQEDFGVNDPAIREAIARHTIPDIGMSQLAKIIYLADVCEPNRRWWPGREVLIDLCLKDLDQAMAYALDQSMEYLTEKGQQPYSRTLEIMKQFKAKAEAGR